MNLEYKPEDLLSSLVSCYRFSFGSVSQETKEKVAKQFVKIIKEESSSIVWRYVFFRGEDIQYLSLEEASLIKQHFLSLLKPPITDELLQAMEGIGAFLIPKPMLPLGNKPLLEHIIEWLKESKKTDQIVLCVSYLHTIIEDYFQNRYLHVQFSKPFSPKHISINKNLLAVLDKNRQSIHIYDKINRQDKELREWRDCINECKTSLNKYIAKEISSTAYILRVLAQSVISISDHNINIVFNICLMKKTTKMLNII